MLELNTAGWVTIIFCAMVIGFSKTAIIGTGILVVPLLALVMPARESTGFLLPMLAMGDIMAIIYWRQHVNWHRLIRLLPWTFIGVVVGFLCMGHISNIALMPIIGATVLVMVAITLWRNYLHGDEKKIPTAWPFAAFMGILAGTTSMLANAAGPVMTIYCLAMRFEKKLLIGTIAWFFWILNLSKMPFSFGLNLINKQSLLTDLALVPFVAIGAIAGVLLVHRIPQKAFNNIIMVLAGLAAIFLCVKPFIMANGQAACLPTQQKETKSMSITIQWLGHASFKITNGATIYIDPWKLPDAAGDADIVLISHSHFDHFSLPDIAEVSGDNTRIIGPADVIAQIQAGQTLTPGQSITTGSVTITATAAYNPNKQFHPRSNNWLGFIIEIDGKRIYYSGDTDLTEEMKSITNIDLALLPVGGTYTLDPAQAAQVTDLIKPKHAIPYHFGDIVGTAGDAEKFAQLAKCPTTVLKPRQTFSL